MLRIRCFSLFLFCVGVAEECESNLFDANSAIRARNTWPFQKRETLLIVFLVCPDFVYVGPSRAPKCFWYVNLSVWILRGA